MEYCNKSLQTILNEKNEGFSCEEIFDIMNQLNNTLRIMNENNIVHRDIKLDNILIKYKDPKDNINSNINFTVKLTDYGISKQLANTTIGRTRVGTPLTMAPEILKGVNEYDSKCDLWSIGIIIYQLFFKEYPFKGRTEVALYNEMTNYEKGKTLIKKTNNYILDNLIESLLIIDPEKRINFEKYFDHPFFNNKIENLIDLIDVKKEIKSEIISKIFNNERIKDDYNRYYEIGNRIQEGKFGLVFRVVDRKTRELKAMKIIDFDDRYANYNFDEEEIKKEILYSIKKMKICSNKNNHSIKLDEFFLKIKN